MSARFEIVRTDAEQPWHARIVSAGRITWRVENLTRQVGAERAICGLLNRLDRPWKWSLSWNVKGVEKVATNEAGFTHEMTVLYIDERRAKS